MKPFYKQHQQKLVRRKWFVTAQIALFVLCFAYYCHDFFIEDSSGIATVQNERLAADRKFHLFFSPRNSDLHRERAYYLAEEAYYQLSPTPKQKSLYREAIHEYREAIRINPNNAKAFFELAKLYQGKFDHYSYHDQESLYSDAIQIYKEMVRVNPDNAEVSFELAKLYQDKFGEYRAANVYYKKCVKIKPTSAEYQRSLAVSYLAINKVSEARYHQSLAEKLERPMAQ